MLIYILDYRKNSPLKIGKTTRPIKQRLKELQTGCPHDLRIIATFRANQYFECQLHKTFEYCKYKSGGQEWYKRDPTLLSFIESIKK